jgi:2-methylcitrate dehydratase PrpD
MQPSDSTRKNGRAELLIVARTSIAEERPTALAANVSVTLNDGRVLRRTVAQFKGTPDEPLDGSELREKFLLLTRHCQPDLMCAMLERLQKLESESSLDWIGLQ